MPALPLTRPRFTCPGSGCCCWPARRSPGWGRRVRGASVERQDGAWSVVEGEPYRLADPSSAGPHQASAGARERSVARAFDPGRPLLRSPGGRDALRAARTPAASTGSPGDQRPVPATGREAGRLRAARGPGPAPGRGGHGAGAGRSPLARSRWDRGRRGGGWPRRRGGRLRARWPAAPTGLARSASRIHWRSAARSGELVEHRLVSGGGSDPLLVLDAYRPDGREALDRAVRAAASLCVALARAGGCNVLLPDRARPVRLDPSLRAWPELHARLAMVEGSKRMPRPPRRGSVAYWVSASPQARANAAAAGVRAGVLVTPGDPEAHDVSSLAGCRARAIERDPSESPTTRAA